MKLPDLKLLFRSKLKKVPGGPAVGTVGSNRTQAMWDSLDAVADLADELKSATFLGQSAGVQSFLLSPYVADKASLRIRRLGDSRALPALPLPADVPVGIVAPGDVLVLSAAGLVASGAPEVSEFDRAAGPGQAVQLTGEQLLGATAAVYANGQLLQATTAVVGQVAQVQLPSNTGPWAAYVLWLKNSAGYGEPVLINRTRALWMTTTLTGGIVGHVFGRNLTKGNARGGVCSVYLKHKTTGAVVACQTTGTNTPERVSFSTPAGLPLGEYWVWVHNNHGGAWGWSERLSCTVIAAADHVLRHEWAGAATLTNTGGDMASTINQATDANSYTNTPTHLPAGTWQVGVGLPIRSTCYLLGDVDGTGVPTTTIQPVHFDKTVNNCGLLGALPYAPGTALLRVENFIIDNSAGADVGEALLNLRSLAQGWLRNVWLRYPGGQLVRLTDNTHGLWLDNCDLLGGSDQNTPFALASSPDAQVYLSNTAFRLTFNADAAINLKGVNHIALLTGCSCNNRDSGVLDGAYQGQGRYLKGSGQSGAGNEGWHVEGNTGNDLGVLLAGPGVTNPSTNDNTSELFMSEAQATSFSAPLASATATTLTFATAPSSSAQGGAAPGVHYAHIVRGRGMGQLRRLTANDGAGTVTVDAPWRVTPDANSLVMVGPFSRWVHVIDCQFTARAGLNGSTYSASAFFEPYGGCHQWYAARNTGTGFRNFTANIATQHNPAYVDSNSFIEVVDNQGINCKWGQRTVANGEGSGIASGQGYPAAGIIAAHYRNTFTNSTQADAVVSYPRTDDPSTATNFPHAVAEGVLYEVAPTSVPVNDYKVIFGPNYPALAVGAGQQKAVATPGPPAVGALLGGLGAPEPLPTSAAIDPTTSVLTFSEDDQVLLIFVDAKQKLVPLDRTRSAVAESTEPAAGDSLHTTSAAATGGAQTIPKAGATWFGAVGIRTSGGKSIPLDPGTGYTFTAGSLQILAAAGATNTDTITYSYATGGVTGAPVVVPPVPLAGTAAGAPVTGDVELAENVALALTGGAGSSYFVYNSAGRLIVEEKASGKLLAAFDYVRKGFTLFNLDTGAGTTLTVASGGGLLVNGQPIGAAGIDYANPVTLSAAATLQANKAYYVTGSGYALTLPSASANLGAAIFVEVASSATGLYSMGAQLLRASESLIVRATPSGWAISTKQLVPLVARVETALSQQDAFSGIFFVPFSVTVQDAVGMATAPGITIQRSGQYTITTGGALKNASGSDQNVISLLANPGTSTEKLLVSNGTAITTSGIGDPFVTYTGYLEAGTLLKTRFYCGAGAALRGQLAGAQMFLTVTEIA